MLDLHINMAIVDESMKIVMVHNVGRNDGNQNVHVSIIGRLHGGAQIKVLDVAHHALPTRCGHDTVEEQLGCDEVCSFGANVTRIFDMVITNSPPDAMQDILFGAMSTDIVQVGGMAPMGNCRDRDEEYSVGPWDGGHALCQVVALSGIGLLPQSTIRTFAEFGILSQLACVGVGGIVMACSVHRAGHWGCTCGCMESM